VKDSLGVFLFIPTLVIHKKDIYAKEQKEKAEIIAQTEQCPIQTQTPKKQRGENVKSKPVTKISTNPVITIS